MSRTAVTDILTDPRFDRQTRLLRLSGWRGDDLRQAADAGWLVRLAPAVCAVATLTGGLLRSVTVLAVIAASAALGSVAANHPVELAANAVARRLGWTPQPPNRAGRRLACVMGTVVLSTAAVALATGFAVLGTTLALAFGAVAAFVAVTNVCVPSILLTLVAGEEACARPRLLGARPSKVEAIRPL